MKWAQFTLFLQGHNPDIIFVQESNTDLAPIPSLSQYDFYFCPPETPRTGTCIALKKNASISVRSAEIISTGHALGVIVEIGYPASMTFLLISFYGPHDRLRSLEVIRLVKKYIENTIARSSIEIHILLGGDFNVTLNPEKDRSCGTERNPSDLAALKNLVTEFDLLDPWNLLRHRESGFTYFSHFHLRTASRLDRFYASRSLVDKVQSIDTSLSFSDHRAVILRLRLSVRLARAPYWRFDNSYLDRADYCNHVRILLSHFWIAHENLEDPITTWEMMKDEISSHDLLYQSLLKKNLSGTAQEGYCTKNGVALVTRMGWEKILANDSPAASHLARWAQKTLPKPLQRLKINNVWEDDPIILRRHVRNHFLALYHDSVSCEQEGEDILDELDTLSEVDKAYLDSPIASFEIITALNSLNRNKSPGIDGITVEFYFKFWDFIHTHFKNMACESFRRGRLPLSTTTAVIALMPKSVDIETIENWRPLSLTNVDYKILAKLMSNRLSKVIATVISTEQSYCVPGRTIFDSISTIRDLVHQHNDGNLPLEVVYLDQLKAFDRVRHQYLFQALERMGFGGVFVGMVRTLYEGALCMVRVSNSLTTHIPFLRGIRQGCPLSGQLFALAFEPLLRRLKQRRSGVELPGGGRLTVSTYADDFNVFVGNEEDFNKILPIFHEYSRPSGACLNPTKSNGLWVGPWKNRPDKPLGFLWSSEGTKFLGVWVQNNTEVEKHLMDTELERRLRQGILSWKPRSGPMSIRGRVLIVNQFIAPEVWHLLQVYTPRANIVRRLQSLLVDFVWSFRKHWVSSTILSAPIPKSTAASPWVKRYPVEGIGLGENREVMLSP
ncbi:hypothetical protein J437_LFUL007741 [Ladona fulva]|uniref:Reverse transcriptase domain-containing protein n=1 Tax=Ladona fulva TaxID=123851 RepID=A0A8K0KG26_LADFU|nr:hypothetical protein J437_LFUL007741 [Ladona fulva]